MLKLIVGTIISAVIGIFTMAMLTASSRADDKIDTKHKEEDINNDQFY